MVDFYTPRVSPTVRSAGQVSNAGSQALKELAGATQMAAGKFSQYYEKKAAIEGDRILAEIQEEWTRTYAERAKSAGPGFAKNTLAGYDQFVDEKLTAYRERMKEQSLANVPDRNMDDIKLVLDKYRMRLETQSLQREAAAAAAASAAAASDALRMRTNAILSDPGLAEDAIEAAPDERSRGAYIDAYLTGLLLSEDPQSVADMMASGRFDADLSPSKKESFMRAAASGLRGLEQERRVETAAARDAFEADLEEGLNFMGVHGFVPPQLVPSDDDFDALYEDEPGMADAMRETYEQARVTSQARYDVGMAAPREISAEIERLGVLIAEPGDTPADVRNRDAYILALKERETALAEDSAGYVVARDETVGQLYGLLQDEQERGGDTGAIASHYASGLASVYRRIGLAPGAWQVLPQPAVEGLANSLNSAPNDVSPQMFNTILEQWKGVTLKDGQGREIAARSVLMRQLDKAGLASEFVTAMRFSDKPALSQAIIGLASVDRAELVNGLETADVKDVSDTLVAGLEDHIVALETGGDMRAVADMSRTLDIAEKLALTYVRRGMDPGAAADRAIEQMFPETPVVAPGFAFRLPEGMGDMESSAMNELEDRQDEKVLREADIMPVDDPRFPEFADVEVTIAAAATTGIWVDNGTGDGVQLMLSIEGALIPMRLKDGSFYEVSFSDIGGRAAADEDYMTRLRIGNYGGGFTLGGGSLQDIGQ